MTEPRAICTCGKVRSCSLHLRAECPPEAAKKWLRSRGCKGPGHDVSYRIGVEPRGTPQGMVAPANEDLLDKVWAKIAAEDQK